MRIAAVVILMMSLTAFAEEPKLEIPKMTKEDALEYVRDRDLALVPSNLVVPIMNGDAETVEALLSAGVDPNDNTGMPKGVLRLAASSCAGKRLTTEQVLVMMEVLLAHGAKPNVEGEKELSALMSAAQQCEGPVVTRLIKAGADMKFKTSLGISPLSMAFIVGNLSAAEALIDAGARLSPEAAAKLLDGEQDEKKLALLKKARAK